MAEDLPLWTSRKANQLFLSFLNMAWSQPWWFLFPCRHKQWHLQFPACRALTQTSVCKGNS